jgi:hypothetical protein
MRTARVGTRWRQTADALFPSAPPMLGAGQKRAHPENTVEKPASKKFLISCGPLKKLANRRYFSGYEGVQLKMQTKKMA